MISTIEYDTLKKKHATQLPWGWGNVAQNNVDPQRQFNRKKKTVHTDLLTVSGEIPSTGEVTIRARRTRRVKICASIQYSIGCYRAGRDNG